ncbi:MAG: hypothetical protein QXW27_02520 [Candidatus Methanomethylicaceae archaeon]
MRSSIEDIPITLAVLLSALLSLLTNYAGQLLHRFCSLLFGLSLPHA